MTVYVLIFRRLYGNCDPEEFIAGVFTSMEEAKLAAAQDEPELKWSDEWLGVKITDWADSVAMDEGGWYINKFVVGKYQTPDIWEG